MYTNNISILVADDDEENRTLVSETLKARGYIVLQAIDGGTAIKVLEEHAIDLAIVDYHMTPKTGIDFARHAILNEFDTSMIMMADELTTDILVEAGNYAIQKVITKPVDTDQLIKAVSRILKARGRNPGAIGSAPEPVYTPEEIMNRTIALARQNARSLMGGPFAAIVADKDGHILGEGVNSVTVRCDPAAHAEVIAIRSATTKLNKTELKGCVIYCSGEPTLLGQALIITTGIETVYYGLSHEEVGATRVNEDGILGEANKMLSQRDVLHVQMNHEEALSMFLSWKKQNKKIAD